MHVDAVTRINNMAIGELNSIHIVYSYRANSLCLIAIANLESVSVIK